MLWRTVLRSSSATWLAPALAVFLAVFVQEDLLERVSYGSWLSALGSAGFALPFVAPACAAAGAWESTRLVRGRADRWLPSRSWLAVVFPLVTPVILLGVFGMVVASFFTIARAEPSVGGPSLGIIAMWVVVLAAHSMAGFLIGKRLPLVLAAPLALGLSFVLTAYPAAFEPLWLRHLVTGGLSECCSLNESLDWRGPGSAVVVALGVLVAALLMMTALSRAVRVSTALGALVAGLTGGVVLAQGLSAMPIVDRASTELHCEGSSPRICLWPEIAGSSLAEMVRENAIDARLRMIRAGLKVPATLTMSSKPGAGELYMGSWSQPTPTAVRSGIAGGLIPSGPPECWFSGQAYPGGAAFGPVDSWLTLTTGADATGLKDRYGPTDVALAVEVTKWAPSRQKAWFDYNSKSLRDCTTKPAVTKKAFDASPAGRGAAR